MSGMKKVVGQASAAAPLAAVIAWAWNIKFPEAAMPAEVAGAIGGIIGPVVSYGVSWLPSPTSDS